MQALEVSSRHAFVDLQRLWLTLCSRISLSLSVSVLPRQFPHCPHSPRMEGRAPRRWPQAAAAAAAKATAPPNPELEVAEGLRRLQGGEANRPWPWIHPQKESLTTLQSCSQTHKKAAKYLKEQMLPRLLLFPPRLLQAAAVRAAAARLDRGRAAAARQKDEREKAKRPRRSADANNN